MLLWLIFVGASNRYSRGNGTFKGLLREMADTCLPSIALLLDESAEFRDEFGLSGSGKISTSSLSAQGGLCEIETNGSYNFYIFLNINK